MLQFRLLSYDPDSYVETGIRTTHCATCPNFRPPAILRIRVNVMSAVQGPLERLLWQVHSRLLAATEAEGKDGHRVHELCLHRPPLVRSRAYVVGIPLCVRNDLIGGASDDRDVCRED